MNALPRILARFTFIRCLTLLGLMLGAASPALAAKTYSDNLDGTVTDPTTGLIWMRCSMGQAWTGSTCTGTASSYTWAQAVALTGTVNFAGHSDWRAPNMRELTTIVDRSRYSPAIDTAAFPNTPASGFWSASADASNSSYAWAVDFYSGYANSGGKDYDGQVRLVRAGQSFGLLNIARPSTDYVDSGNGTVTHTPTGLMWQRCAVGQSWTVSACGGSAITFSWDAAKLLTSSFMGQTDWRLPTEEELVSLVDYSQYSPAINTTLFPNAPASDFWSASATAYDSDGAWVVNFGYGYAYNYLRNYSYQVRLVRAGQSFGPLTLSVSKTGTGQVNGSVMPGIECGTVCNSGYYPGDVVTLNATPTANLISWGGACSGSAATCSVTMDAAKSVTASFLDTPLISGLPTALTFVAQNVGSTSTAQSVTMTNSGATALTIATIAANGDYGVTHNCGTGLGAGGFCTLNITFTPTASGTRTGSVTITSNAPDSPHSISLTGTGQGSTSIVSPASLSFAAQGLGTTSAAQTVTLSNTGGLVLNIASVVANGDFAISASTCGAALAQASSCSIGVTFTPTVVGARSGSLVVTSDATSSPNTVSLSGTGTAVALVSLSPASLSFVSQGVGTSSTAQTIALTNSGGASLNLTSITASGDFAVTNNCGGGLAAGGSCSLSVTFTPTAAGTRTGTITITSNATGSPHSVSLTGTIGTLTPPVCTLSASPVVIAVGSSSTLTASCTPAATSYVWTNSGFGSGVSSGAVSPTTPTVYTVVASNAAGSSNTASTAVYVCNTAPSQIYAGQTLVGTGASEPFHSGIGNDAIDGGAGINTVIYNCNRSSFTLTKTASGWMVSSSAEGIDTLTNIDRIQFPNETLALDISGNAGQAYRVYQAAFNRTPDNAGLKFWIGVMDNGASLNDVAAGFINSAEFQSLYGANPTNPEFVTKLYSNVLHRAPDQAGYDYWVDVLNRHLISNIDTLVNFSESPENQAGVLGAILNGIDLLN